MALSRKDRDALPADSFAVPGKRALPIHDASHVRMAWDMVSRTHGLSTEERKDARTRIIAKAKSLGIDTADWEKGKFSARMTLSAMALNISNDDEHPNKMPFSGILTRIGEPSDAPVGGANGKHITISLEAAEKALPTLLGMAVNFSPDFDGHDAQAKVGIFTGATIEGNAIQIEGFIYAADFPEVAAEIKANKDVLGFSYETRNNFCSDPDANPVVITECVFTGAAILLKDKAAYRTTSLAASAEEDIMDPKLQEFLDKLAAGQAKLTETVSGIVTTVDEIKKGPPALTAANLLPKIEPHAKALENLAAAMEGEGVGSDTERGHATYLRRMAGQMRSEAAQGRIPNTFSLYAAAVAPALDANAIQTAVQTAVDAATKPLKDALAASETKITDLTAKATKAATEPERKTVSPAITALLAKGGIEMPTDGSKIPVAKLDVALKDMPVQQRMQVKAALGQAALID
jgi:hypothetical protein